MQRAGTIEGKVARSARRIRHLRCIWCDMDLPDKGYRKIDQKVDSICADCARDPFLRMNTVTKASLAAVEAEKKKEEADGSH